MYLKIEYAVAYHHEGSNWLEHETGYFKVASDTFSLTALADAIKPLLKTEATIVNVEIVQITPLKIIDLGV